MALDLTDSLSPQWIRERLSESETLQGKKLDLEALAKVIASVRGVTLGVRVGSDLSGTIEVDFGQDVSTMTAFAKPLFFEALGNRGAMIDDFESWQVQVDGKQISLAGQLSQTGLRQLLSVVDARTSSFGVANQSASQGQGNATAQSSLQYFKSVTILLKDLDGLRRFQGAATGAYSRANRRTDYRHGQGERPYDRD